jgi:hypothetical protein
MRELRFDGLSPDGGRLVLAGKDGQKYTVEIDERIEAAVRRDRARIGQVEIEQAGVLRPREIQARIRAGATAEDVAAASGLPLEHVRRFEGPVLTERAWVAEQAQATELRRPGGDIELGDLVAERLAGEGLDPADISWDAWRRDDGLWVVIATFPLGPNTHVATWNYDSGSRTMTVADENAQSLSAISPDAPLDLVAARPTLSSVAPLEVDEDEDDEPVAIISATSRRESYSDTPAEDPDGQAAEAPREPADDPQISLPEADAQSEEADRIEAELEAEQVEQAPGLLDPEEDAVDEADDDVGDFPVDEGLDTDPDAEAPDEGAPGTTDEDEATDEPDEGTVSGATTDAEDVPLFDAPEPKAAPRPGQRAAVPSFDDILFGPGPGA